MVIFGEDAQSQERVAGAITTLGAVSVYILGESHCDAKNMDKSKGESFNGE